MIVSLFYLGNKKMSSPINSWSNWGEPVLFFWSSLGVFSRLHPLSYAFSFLTAAAAAAKSLQLRLTVCDPTDGSPPGSSVPGILQARTLEWLAISFSNAWKWKVKVKSLSRVLPPATPWTAAHQAPPSMGFSRQEHWSGVPFLTIQCLNVIALRNLWKWYHVLCILVYFAVLAQDWISKIRLCWV